MAVHNVADHTELSAAISAAVSGDTIRCADGRYPPRTFSRDFTDYVTIEAENQYGAVFDKPDVNNGSFWRFSGIKTLDTPRCENNAHNLIFEDCDLHRLYFRDGHHVYVRDNIIGDVSNVLTLNGIDTFEITGNTIGPGVDLLRVPGSGNGIITYNKFGDMNRLESDHPDSIQGFAYNSLLPYNILIEKNQFYDDPSTGHDAGGGNQGQGVFFTGGTMPNIVVRQNLFFNGHTNTIYLSGGDGSCIIENNTIHAWGGAGGGRIRLEDKFGLNTGVIVRNNVCKALYDQSAGANQWINNYEYVDPAGADAVLQGGAAGGTRILPDGKKTLEWRDLLPVPGSAIDFGSGLGADEYLLELQNGGNPPMADFLTITPGSVIPDNPAAGTYTIVGTPGQPDHKVHFVPAPGFTGPAGGTYDATDQSGNPIGPTRFDFNVTDPLPTGTADVFPDIPNNHLGVDLDVLGNDLADTPA